MSGSSSLSAAARLHVVKADPDVIDVESHPQPQESGANARPQTKGKGKGKGKAKAKGNPVRDGSPATPAPGRELAGSRHGADHWDDLRRAWAGYLSQSKKGGQGTQQPRHHQPGGQASGSGHGQGRRGHGGGRQAHAGQKRKATATNATVDDGRDHAAKRQKRAPPRGAGAGASEGEDEAQRHPDFWHPDGSVIVEVGKTKFKLHQSTLQKNSTYFADAFREWEGGRRPDVRGPKRSNLPVYRVTETMAEDFTSLLTVIEEPMCVSLPPFLSARPRPMSGSCAQHRVRLLLDCVEIVRKYADDGPPIPVLTGVLRAARALSFDAQRKWADRTLERTWSATLEALTADPTPHAAEAFAFARACGLRGVQKRASYELLRMPTFGQTVVADADAGAREQQQQLPRADMLRLLHAREQLGLAWAEVAGKAPTDFACPRSSGTQTQQMQPERAGAAGGGSCASANVDRVHARWAELVHSSGLYVQRMVDPLMGLQDLMGISWKDEGFCRKCVSARKNAWYQLRTKLWDDLDMWLELNVEKVD